MGLGPRQINALHRLVSCDHCGAEVGQFCKGFRGRILIHATHSERRSALRAYRFHGPDGYKEKRRAITTRPLGPNEVIHIETDRRIWFEELAEGLANALQRVEEIAAAEPGRYFICRQQRHAVLARIDTRASDAKSR